MKYLAKSKFGAAAAGTYLLILFGLFMVANFGEGGLHAGKAFMAGLSIFILTLPLSWLALSIGVDFLWIVMLALGTLINATVIYFVVGLVSRGLQSIFSKGLK